MVIRTLLIISIFFSACNFGDKEIVVKKIPVVSIPKNYLKINQGKMAEVDAEQILYIGEHDSTYFIHVIIYNISPDTIYVSLADYFKTVYANSWMFIDTTSLVRNGDRTMIDYKALTEKEKTQLKKDFSEKKLRKISPGDSLEYFDNFWTVSDITKQGKEGEPKCPYFAISLRGRLSFTNGKDIEDFYAGQKDNFSDLAELDIRWPVVAKPIPANAFLSKR